MTRTTILPLAAAAVLLAGCMPVPPSAPMSPMTQPLPAIPAHDPMIAPPLAPVESLPTLANTGPNERKPDVCGAAGYRQHIGKPASALPSLGISRSYRVVEYRGIEPQDYDPNRLVFRLDAFGNINDLDCG